MVAASPTKPSQRQLVMSVISAIAVVGISIYVYRRSSSKGRRGQSGSRDGDFDGEPKTALEAQFREMAEQIRTVESMKKLHQLQLYGLFKQITVGPCQEPQPSMFNLVATAKHNAWKDLGNMPKQVAAMLYNALASDILSGAVGDDENDADEDEDGMFMQAFGGSKPSTLINGENGEDDVYAEGTLHMAASNEDPTILKMLLDKGDQDPNTLDDYGQTPLHLAADRGHVDCATVLLDAGADIHLSDDDGFTPLHLAVIAESVPTCKLLLGRGADPDKPDSDGTTPRQSATEDGADDLKALFK
eukprot:CAMPEP_0198117540 /NCGR_PEP_ID=MMETSP1442-20131203/18503_1 /TAXON_ID= /ORGANISM="Craspedostauros australis, Strain CCMP3328" /LENGTH=301 /DNA_ID=CAMNT_0043775611 /DNA_START=41 /DNA_END=946 /DNA_ORIENTATION=+